VSTIKFEKKLNSSGHPKLDPNTPGDHRYWEMSFIKTIRNRHPDKKIFYVMIGMTPIVFVADESSAERHR